jgi:hypothetical protein
MINRAMILALALLFVIAYISEAQVVEDGLVAYWSFDRADKQGEDIFGGHDGRIVGNPKTVPGKVNKALELNGTGDWIEAEIPDGVLAEGATLEVWFQQETAAGFGVMLLIQPEKAELNIDPERGGRSELWCYAARGIEGPDGLRDGDWHHAVGTVSKKGQIHYIDGENVGTNPNPVEFERKSTVVIGQRPGRGLLWEGKLDEIRVYGRPLSENEIRQNMEAKGLSVEAAAKLPEIWGRIKNQAR